MLSRKLAAAGRLARWRSSPRLTVLGLAVAAIAAILVPFSVLSISALSGRAAPPAAITSPHPPGATPSHGAPVTTRVSGATGASSPSGSSSPAAAPAPPSTG